MGEETRATATLDPLIGVDIARLEKEMEQYQSLLDEDADYAYRIAEEARQQNLDPKPFVEIPRASDLASRTEKLLIEHLEAYPVADDIREMLAEHDRETTSIMMAQRVAKGFREQGYDMVKSIDVGLRVGLAILTEAVLVAPLEGISEVRLLNNLDGSPFVSVHFAGPIRAAGGTAQALAVLIADMIRRELKVGPYIPSDGEVERVKEEFGLYRGNLQYRPSPKEIEEIVRACPVMINGESTESIECAGYGRVRNIDEARIRGGVLLVIGEGMCLKAPKIQKHTERLNVPGWDFISKFASKGEDEGGSNDPDAFKSRKVQPIDKFMKDIIAGRPIFGGPQQPGGFRLRYGRGRPSGLAAASLNPASMLVLDDFITVGTQMKIERPGKACAVTPSNDSEGPYVVLSSGQFLRVDESSIMQTIRPDIRSIWDNGEIVIGYGEFMENNKNLVPAGYTTDWWASDLIDALRTQEDVEAFVKICDCGKDVPEGVPGVATYESAFEQFHIRRRWHRFLSRMTVDWNQASAIAERWRTSLPPPHNPWFLDLPLEWVPNVIKALQRGKVEDAGKMPDSSPENPFSASKWLRFTGAASGWDPTEMDKLQPESIPPVSELQPIGYDLLPEEPIFQETLPEAWTFMQHGLLKGALLLLGIPHHHEGDDIVATCGWQALLNGFGFTTRKSELHQLIDLGISVEQRILELRDCNTVLRAERARLFALEKERSTIRIAAETEARQRGLGISETDQVGKEAAESVPDEGPENASRYKASQRMHDDHEVDGLLPLIRESSTLRWEHAAPQRVGCRMGRPEKSAPREMSPRSHTLFPIALEGGNQRLIANAAGKGSIRVQMGKRLCSKCGKDSPFITCHHRVVDSDGLPKIGETCGGRTDMRESSSKSRRRGEMQSVPIEAILEDAQLRIGMTRLPQQVKCVKELKSKNQTPEAIEKGLIRAKYNLPVFRDGTIRFDMSDVPVTHFTPKEIYVDWKRLHALGYTHDWEGNPLERDDQMLELFPQDFIVAKNAADYFIRTAQFVDEVLVKYYKMDPYYNATTKDDLVGQLICALAPHTSGGVLSRIIGWADCSGGYAHPLFHAAKRRNCDGDEDAIMLLMDGLLNFSREILPANRGGQMDAPLVLTTRLNPTEIDKEALNVDSAWFYERQFYEATLNQPHPKDIADSMDFVERRLGTVAAVRGYGYTHDCERMDEGPELSAYKTLATMIDKMNGQLNLCQRLRAINARTVASSVIRSHFLPDLRGNLNAYGRQKIRCLKCGNSYRRMPLAGHCIQPEKVGGRGLSAHGVARSEGGQCNGKLALTVSEGAVRKYIKVTKHVMDTYGVDTYTRQNMEWLAGSVESLFSNDRAKQMSLSDFL
ncbi:MAG: hypothetical protein ISR25_04725 [Candidatus Poseidoniaceae archaeon]|nr:hypothetical protein [Candidatus Poseidoniaceae archaeon]